MSKTDKKYLEDGIALQKMVNFFFEEQSELRMMQLLNCLTDCQVMIPCNMRLSEENHKILDNA